MTKTIVAIDGANLYSAARSCDLKIDFNKLLVYLHKTFPSVVRVNYYTGLFYGEDGSCEMQKFVDFLDFNGYTVISKESKTVGNRVKANMDAEIIVDLMEISPHVDQVVLISGDGDFKCLLQYLQRKAINTVVISDLTGDEPTIAYELRRQCDQFIDLGEIRKHIEQK